MTEHRQALPKGYRLFDTYVIKEVLGQGGFGITYKAFDEPLNTDVAIKEYFPSSLAMRGDSWSAQAQSSNKDADYAKGLKRFQREMQALSQFKHHGILRVRTLFEANNTAYAVLDFEEGQTLSTWVRKQKRAPTQEVLDGLVRPILDALETVHDKGILHRDISPGNIMVRPDGSPVLIDFGSARQYTADAGQLTTSIIVTHGFSPPEQYRHEPGRQGPPSDLYSLAATFYYLVTGDAPAKSDARETAVMNQSPDPLKPASEKALRKDYRPALLAAIDWALRLDPGARPQTVADWREKLFALGEATEVIPEERTEVISTTRPSAGRWRKWALTAGALAVIGAGAFLGWQEIENARRATKMAKLQADVAQKAREAAEAEARRQRTAMEAAEEKMQREEAKAYYEQGASYSKNKDYDRAITEFTKAIERDPAYA